MTSYAKGVRGEKKSRAWLEARGYFVVEARGSHGACDLVAIGSHDVQVIQVKSGRKPSPSERQEVKAAMDKIPRTFLEIGNVHIYVTAHVLHHWKDYAREPMIESL